MRHRRSSAAVLVPAALLLTACGGSSPLEGRTGPEVAALAADALEEAGSVHVAGSIVQDGAEVGMDLRMQDEDVAGTLTFDGAGFGLVTVDGELYVEASPEFLAPFDLAAGEAARYEGRWVALPRESAGEYSDLSLAGMVEELRRDDIDDDVRRDELDGQDVVVVEHADGTRVVVADDDPAHPLRMTGDEDSEGELVFSDHGEDQGITVPEDVVALEEITELAGS